VPFHIFGAATETGEPLGARLFLSCPIVRYFLTLANRARLALTLILLILRNLRGFYPADDPNAPSAWISSGPIWLLAPFFEQLAHRSPERFEHLSGLIACSSSSALTKRFASNFFDRELAARPSSSEDRLISACHSLGVECRVLRPAIIYGQAGP